MERALPEPVQANIEARYHLDEPLARQYLRYLGDVLRGDLGPSFGTPIAPSTSSSRWVFRSR
jgi:oligopeptide transport system permease protein